ncbi:MAG: hypothetical protein EPN93_21095 [Spirochaetes bacterium]|nr:MAG: hypothetical protein EPN93_21095 [Spirochaetota bacterium]
MATTIRLFIAYLSLAIVLGSFSSCILSPRHDTAYSRNQEADQGKPVDQGAIVSGIGQYRYDILVEGMGRYSFDRLAYGMGQSNMIHLINIISDVNKLVALLSEPHAISPEDVVDLMNYTDQAIGVENPPSDDTLGKIANLINNVNDMNYFKEIILGVTDRNGKTGMERLTMVVALVDEYQSTMPTILNQVACTPAGLQTLLRIFNQTDDMKDLVTVINGTTNLINVTGVMNNITNFGNPDDGTGALVATLNHTTDPARLAFVINGLAVTGVISNDDDFELPQANNNWAVSGNAHWQVTSSTAFSGSRSLCAGVATLNPMDDNETASAEIVTRFTTAGTISFARKVSTETNWDYLKFYVDDVLVDRYSGELPWAELTYGPYAAGVHRLRWEYVKDASTSAGEDAVYIDKVVLPGNRGADLLPYMKVAILLNQLSLSHETTIAETLNSLNAAGLDNLVYMVNHTVYPPNPDVVEPRIVSIVNNLSDIDTLTRVINGLEGDAPRQMTDIMDFIADVSKVYGMVDGLAGNPGEKLYRIVNGVTPAGTVALMRFLDGISLADILTVMNGVESTDYVPAIFNNLDLAGTNVSALGATSAPTAGSRLVNVINEIADGDAPGAGLTVGYHVVRMLNDISAYGGGTGAANVGRIVSGLKNTTNPDGATRMVLIMESLGAHNDAARYTDPLCDSGDCTSDKFGRLTAFINDMSGNGTGATVALINGVNSGSLPYLTGLIGTAKRIRYISDVINSLTNVNLMLSILNEPGLDVTRLRRVLDCMGDKSYPGRTAPSPRYTDALSTAENDALGRMTVLVNEVVTPAGASNLITILNDIEDMDKLTGLLAKINENGTAKSGGGMNRVRYLSDTINNVANISLMMNILNGPPGYPEADYDPLVGLMNEVGGSVQKGNGIKSVGDLSIVWGVINLLGWNYVTGQSRTPAEQARAITLVNEVNRCGIQSGYELSAPWDHLLTEPCSSGRKRLSEFMLGMDNPDPVAIIVGNVTDTMKTVAILNGYQDIQQLINLINLLPGEVTAAFLNTMHNTNNVVYGSTLYLMNKLSYDAMAGMMHFGTGIGEGGSRTGNCNYFPGVGPVRMARLLNSETGPRLYNMLTNFGWRTAIPAMVCGFGVVNNQSLENRNGGATQYFPATETIQINGPHYTGGAWVNGLYTHSYQVSPGNTYNCLNYYNETISTSICGSPQVDSVIWSGASFCLVVSVDPGITSAWDAINGDGFLGWLLSWAGTVHYPPYAGTSDKNWPKCRVCPLDDEPAVIYKSGQRYPEYAYPPNH